jgi:hypothetical protein
MGVTGFDLRKSRLIEKHQAITGNYEMKAAA